MMAHEALKKTLELPNIKTIADIGCGPGLHSKQFLLHGKIVHGYDFKDPNIGHENFLFKKGPFGITQEEVGIFDCVWMSHVLEHILNIQSFLENVHTGLKPGGYIVVTVPPAKNNIVGGHVSLWNAGLVMYRLALAGFDCSSAMVKTYGYNISVIAKKTKIPDLSSLNYDNGDIEKLAHLLPKGYNFQSFNGCIQSLNW